MPSFARILSVTSTNASAFRSSSRGWSRRYEACQPYLPGDIGSSIQRALLKRWELAVMKEQASQFIGIGGWAKPTRITTRAFWMKLREAFDAYRRWRAAEIAYTELARLSDVALERRGIARGDLGRVISEMDMRH
jgi:uncharacterized protein YjiS (DUF1127 family)